MLVEGIMFTLFFILYLILFAGMFISIILFEHNSKKIIFWGLIISLTSIFGYLIYFLFYSDRGYLKKYLKVKEKEDIIYKKLVEYKVLSDTANCDLINFAKRVYDENFYKNSKFEILKREDFNEKLIQDIECAKNFIILDSFTLLDSINPEIMVASLIEKHKSGVSVKVVYSKIARKDKDFFKQLKLAGVRVCKFTKFVKNSGFYKNNKNIISIDGNVTYLYSRNIVTNRKANVEYFSLFYRLSGDIVKSIDLHAHLDVTFATRKYYSVLDYSKHNIKSNIEFQYIGTNINNSLLDLILKAIIEAKDSIVIHVDKFIPNESILEAIKLAAKSNIKVKLMISNVNRQYGYYTSRFYVKELAREGVVCYYFDGHINSNYVVIDEEIVMLGTISFVNQSLLCDLQDVLLISDKSTAQQFIDMFNNSINNSYKLCNPKRILFREKFFIKFM